VTADGYEDYTSSEIEVKNEGVNYLDDWIKMTPDNLVQVVLDNEAMWKADISACDTTILSNIAWEEDPRLSSLDADDTFWFQDLDMDGTPEFIVESKAGLGDLFLEKAWNVYYMKDSTLVRYQGDSSIVDCTLRLYYDDESHVPYQLYKDNTTGKFINLRNGGVMDTVYGQLNLLHLEDISWEQDLFMVGFSDIPDFGCVLTEGASSPADVSSNMVTISHAEGLEWYNSYKSNLTAYSYTIQKIDMSDWDGMSSEEKQQILKSSYDAWSYSEDPTKDFPLSDEMNNIILEDAKYAYMQKIDELSKNTESLNTIDYCLFDMNTDGIPELIVKTGTCEADYTITFYTYKNNAITVVGDGFSGGHSSFCYDSDTKQFCTKYGQMGVGGIEWYAFDGNTVTLTNSVYNIEYDTLEVHFDNYDDAYAPYGTFSGIETAYCWYWDGEWITSYYTPAADGSYATTEYSGIDYSLIDNHVATMDSDVEN
jgi:hypothetical protein